MMTEAAEPSPSGDDHADLDELEPARRESRRYLLPVITLVTCLVLFPAFTVLYVAWSQGENNHKFCQMVAAVATPAPPAGAAPSRAYDRTLHASAVSLKGRLGC